MAALGFDPPPPHLVEDGRQRLGRFDAAVARTNLIDARYRGLPRPLRWARLKEWQALQVTTPRLFLNVALFDAKLMGLRQVKIYDRARARKYLDEHKLLPGALRIADTLLDSVNAHRDRAGCLVFENRLAAAGTITVEVEVAARRDHPRIAGRLVVRARDGASQVVSLPFATSSWRGWMGAFRLGRTRDPSGARSFPGAGGMYSHKGMFPVEGELTIGDEVHRIGAGEGLALLDDHKGYYPYVMRWDWVTAAAHGPDGRARGVNLTQNQCLDPERNNENCGWIGAQVGRLPAVRFERVRDPAERWLIKDREGRVDVVFEPTVPGDVRVQALVVESRYRGPFGVLRGRVAPEGLDPIEIDGWFGMGEEFWLRV